MDCVKFTHSDNFVYSADDIGIIKQWDMNTDSHTTYHGHMKSVRTLDMHPSQKYFVSGSNDTTIRLWDTERSSESLAKYRAHIATVNQVQFSPDGNWIASAGAEGTVLIWEVRMSAQIKEFLDSTSAVSCVQFHPSEYLVAAGRTNGTVDIFDLDANKLLRRIKLSTGTVKCCLFSEHGQWLFVGTDNGVTVVLWETDQQLDFIESSWTSLFSMKLVKNKLMCGSLDGAQVQVHAFNVELIGRPVPVAQTGPAAYLNQSNGNVSLSNLNNTGGGGGGNARTFLYSQQKELGKDRFRMMGMAQNNQQLHQQAQQQTHLNQGTDEDSGSPSSNLSIEMLSEDVDETLTQTRLNQMADDEGGDSDTIEFAYPDNGPNFDLLKRSNGLRGGGVGGGGVPGSAFDSWHTDEAHHSLSVASSSSPSYDDTVNPEFRLSLANRNVEVQRGHLEYHGISSSPTSKDLERFDRHTDEFLNNSQFFNSGNSDLGYRSDSGGDCLLSRDGGTAEDFPVNNAAPPTYAPKSVTATSSAVTTGRMSRQRTSIGFVAPNSRVTGVVQPQMSSGTGRLTQAKRMGSLSVTNLSELGGDNKFRSKNGGVKAPNTTRYRAGGSPVRTKLKNDYNANLNKENQAVKNNNKNGNFKVEFFGKPPTRSRSSFDMRSAGVSSASARGQHHNQNHPQQHQQNQHLQGNGPVRREIPVHTSRMGNRMSANYDGHHQNHYGGGYGESMESQEINHIASGHQRVFQELCNRHATLKMNKDVAIMQDVLIAIRQIARVDTGSLVDILGAVLEKS